MVRAEAVSKLTTESATHALWLTSAGYLLQTTVDGSLVSEKAMSTDEAMKWCDLTLACGGVVYGEVVAS